MRVNMRLWALLLAGTWASLAAHPPVGAAAEMCPMGGALIVVATDRGKALAWGGSRARAEVNDDAADWSVLTFSPADEGIALLVGPGQVFFGVSGRGGETYPRDIERAFGAGHAKLREAVGRGLSDLAAAGVVTLEAADIQAIAGAAGLGALEKGAGGWALTIRNCQAVDLPTAGL